MPIHQTIDPNAHAHDLANIYEKAAIMALQHLKPGTVFRGANWIADQIAAQNGAAGTHGTAWSVANLAAYNVFNRHTIFTDTENGEITSAEEQTAAMEGQQ